MILFISIVYELNGIAIQWNNNQYATAYKILVSEDGSTYQEVLNITGNSHVNDVRDFTSNISARFVKFAGVAKNANYYGIREFEVYSPVNRSALKTELANTEMDEITLEALSVYQNVSATQKDIDTALQALK